MKATRYFRIKRSAPFGGRKMKYVRKEGRNYILALLRPVHGVVVDWKVGATFEFAPEECSEIQ